MKIKILSTSDVHGHIYPTSYVEAGEYQPFGMLKAAKLISDMKHQEADDEIVIAIENGDWIQGSPFASYMKRFHKDGNEDIFTKITSLVGYDAGVLGNHEFNYGLSYIKSAEKKRQYKLLGANIDGAQQKGIVDAPYVILDKKGVKIAILGLTTQYVPNWEKPENIEGLTFESALKTAKKYVPELKKQADVVIVAYHGGFEAELENGKPSEPLTGENEGYQLLTEVSGIDALVTGHQHREIAGVYHNIPTTQPGFRGTNIGEIDLELNNQKEIVKKDAKLIKVGEAKLFKPVQLLTDQIEANVQKWLDTPIGHITGASMEVTNPMSARLNNHPFLEFINQVQMAATGVDISSTALFSDEVRGLKSEVTIRQILNSYKYANTLVSEQITGLDLKQALERCASFFDEEDGKVVVAEKFRYPKMQYYNYDIYSGVDYAFDLQKPVGQRLQYLKYHGEDVTDEQPLKVALNHYRGNGGGDYPMFSNDKIIKEIDTDLVDLLISYLEEHKVVNSVEPHNLKIEY